MCIMGRLEFSKQNIGMFYVTSGLMVPAHPLDFLYDSPQNNVLNHVGMFLGIEQADNLFL